MPVPYLIIDGYNLMHAAGIARRSYGRGDLQRCRDRLIRELASLLSTAARQRTTIVFDAFRSESDQHRLQRAGDLAVLFAPRGTDADGEIERMLLQHSSPRQVIVVSSDHRLHKAAGRRKARCIDSEEFWAALSSGEQTNLIADQSRLRTEDAGVSVDDINHWKQHVGSEGSEAGSPADGEFDDEYLRQLEEQLRNDDFGADGHGHNNQRPEHRP